MMVIVEQGGPMTAAKPKRETWLDLMPPGKRPSRDTLITRDELLAELHERGIELSPIALATQERRGFLPRALRSRRNGSPVALYPTEAVDWVAHARQLQDSGTPLRQIGPVIRTHVLISTGHGTLDTTPGISDVVSDLETALAKFSEWHEHTHGTPVAAADARLLDASGAVLQRFGFEASKLVRHSD